MCPFLDVCSLAQDAVGVVLNRLLPYLLYEAENERFGQKLSSCEKKLWLFWSENVWRLGARAFSSGGHCLSSGKVDKSIPGQC